MAQKNLGKIQDWEHIGVSLLVGKSLTELDCTPNSDRTVTELSPLNGPGSVPGRSWMASGWDPPLFSLTQSILGIKTCPEWVESRQGPAPIRQPPLTCLSPHGNPGLWSIGSVASLEQISHWPEWSGSVFHCLARGQLDSQASWLGAPALPSSTTQAYQVDPQRC